jgi:small nuclear ribonucleoprotein (snRNP)-like protein
MKVGILTTTEKESLDGQLVQVDWYFNPVLDCNGDWVISTQEIDASIYPQNDWIKSLPLIDWCPPLPIPLG